MLMAWMLQLSLLVEPSCVLQPPSELAADAVRRQAVRALRRYDLPYCAFAAALIFVLSLEIRLNSENVNGPAVEWISPGNGIELARRDAFLRAVEGELEEYDHQLAAEYPPNRDPLGLEEDRKAELKERIRGLRARAESLRSTEVAAPVSAKAGLALALGELRTELSAASAFFNSQAD